MSDKFQPIAAMPEGMQTLTQRGFRFPDGTVSWANPSQPSLVSITDRKLSVDDREGTLYFSVDGRKAPSVKRVEQALMEMASRVGLYTDDNYSLVEVERVVIIVACPAVEVFSE